MKSCNGFFNIDFMKRIVFLLMLCVAATAVAAEQFVRFNDGSMRRSTSPRASTL